MKKFIFLLFVFILQFPFLNAQKDEVNKYLRLVAYGKIDEVRAVLPDLLAKYPNDAGIKLLHGTILEDAFLALEVYQSILKNYPESEWADHAFWRIVQFYAVLGDTAKAQSELANFRSRYPASPFITPASDVVRSAVNLSRKNLKTTSSITLVKTETKQSPIETKSLSNENTAKSESKPNNNVNPVKMGTAITLQSDKPANDGAKISEKSNIEKLVPENKQNNLPAIKNEKPIEQVVVEKPVIKQEPKSDDKSTQINIPQQDEYYGLQVGIYKDKNSAEAEKNKFLVKRLRTQVVEKQVNGALMYAVVIGHYSSLESAEEGKKIVSIQCNCDPVIYKK